MDWLSFLVNVFMIVFRLTMLIPGIVAFFSLRHALCSLIAWIVVFQLGIFIIFTQINLPSSISFQELLITCFSLVICYLLLWAVIHFVLPKTFLSKISKKVRVVIGIILLVIISFLIFITSDAAVTAGFVHKIPPTVTP